jgi:hypothetical protein
MGGHRSIQEGPCQEPILRGCNRKSEDPIHSIHGSFYVKGRVVSGRRRTRRAQTMETADEMSTEEVDKAFLISRKPTANARCL